MHSNIRRFYLEPLSAVVATSYLTRLASVLPGWAASPSSQRSHRLHTEGSCWAPRRCLCRSAACSCRRELLPLSLCAEAERCVPRGSVCASYLVQGAARYWVWPGSRQKRYRLEGKRDAATAVVCLQLGDGVDCDFADWTVEVSLALFRVLVLVRAELSIGARRVCVAARLCSWSRAIGGFRDFSDAAVGAGIRQLRGRWNLRRGQGNQLHRGHFRHKPQHNGVLGTLLMLHLLVGWSLIGLKTCMKLWHHKDEQTAFFFVDFKSGCKNSYRHEPE